MKDKIDNLTSINDLKELEFTDSGISPQQRLAIKNFNRHRFKVLTAITNEDQFHSAFQQLQVASNLTSFEEYLKEDYL